MIVIYGKDNCVWCKRAVALAESRQMKFKYIDVMKDGQLEALKEKLPDVRTVPQIWWGDKHVGGFEGFQKEIEEVLGANYGQEKF